MTRCSVSLKHHPPSISLRLLDLRHLALVSDPGSVVATVCVASWVPLASLSHPRQRLRVPCLGLCVAVLPYKAPLTTEIASNGVATFLCA